MLWFIFFKRLRELYYRLYVILYITYEYIKIYKYICNNIYNSRDKQWWVGMGGT